MSHKRKKVRYVYKGISYSGQYKLEGLKLSITSELGALDAYIGLFEPRQLAKILLRKLCERAFSEGALSSGISCESKSDQMVDPDHASPSTLSPIEKSSKVGGIQRN